MAQEIRFEHLPRELGISRRSVRAITQDDAGFLWFATSDGLLRFDGYEVKAFRYNVRDTASLSDNNVRTVFKDSHGDLWVGFQGAGLNRFDPRTEQVTRYRHVPSNPHSLGGDDVWSITEDTQGNIWIGTWAEGLSCWERTTNRFRNYRHAKNDAQTLGEGPVWDVLYDPEGYVWAAIDGGGVSRLDLATQTFTRFAHNPSQPNSLSDNFCYALHQDRSGALWIGTKLGVVNRLAPKENIFTRYTLLRGDIEGSSSVQVYAMMEQHAGEIWIATNVGLQILDVASGELTLYQSDPSNFFTLSNNNVHTMFKDQTGMVWLGNEDGGINKVASQKAFQHYTHTPKDPTSLSFKTVRSMGEDRNGTLWVGTQGGGLNRFNAETETFTRYRRAAGQPTSLAWDEISAVYEDTRGRFWVGSWGDGLKQMDRASGTFRHLRHTPSDFSSISSNFIQAIYEDSFGVLWVATENGLNREEADGSWRIYYHIAGDTTSLNANNLQSKALVEDEQGNLWIGTWKGLNRYQRTSDTFRSWGAGGGLLSNEHVISLYDDHNGTLWIGTFGGGLNKFDKKTETFTYYTQQDGLPNDVVFAILEDAQGLLWLSTNSGLVRFDPNTETFQHYTETDGLQGNEFYWGAATALRDGRLAFGGVNGFNIFHPDSIVSNPHIPPVLLTGFQKYDKEAALPLPAHTLEEVVLSYKENFFSIEFAALNYRDTYKNQYTYKLEGFHDDWIFVGTKREVSFSNLEGGTYTFLVKGSNNDGLWNETPASLRIVIVPPVWKTWWFQTLLAVFVGLCIIGLYQFRIRTIKQQKARLAAQVAERTAELRHANASLVQQKEEIGQQAEELAQQRDNLSQANQMIAQRLNDIKTLSEIGQNVTASIEIKEIISRIYTSVNALMDAPNFEIGIIDWKSKQISYYGFHDADTPMQWGFSSVKTEGTLTYWCITHEAEILIANVETELDAYQVSDAMRQKYLAARARAINYIPLKIEGKLMGMMITKSFRPHAYTDIHVQLLRNLASYISIALSNANAYEALDKNNALMRDSITYAQTIQRAILPTDAEFEQFFKEHFILYYPKDIVSGDFYWLNRTEEYLFVAAVDCTGHGVPGAFMSLIANSLLNRIVNEQGVYAPSLILQRLDNGIRKALRQEESANDDGMDIVLCRFPLNRAPDRPMLYASAKGGIWIQHNAGELSRLPITRRSVGGKFYGKNIPFEQHEVLLQPGDLVYLLSDGMIDAVDVARKRFGSARFQRLLASIMHLPLAQQKEAVEQALAQHQQGADQRDDITILGLRY